MGDISKFCPMCGATPGNPCTYISTIPADHEMVREGYEVPHAAGEDRPEPHFYRGNDYPIPVPVKDEPPYYLR